MAKNTDQPKRHNRAIFAVSSSTGARVIMEPIQDGKKGTDNKKFFNPNQTPSGSIDLQYVAGQEEFVVGEMYAVEFKKVSRKEVDAQAEDDE